MARIRQVVYETPLLGEESDEDRLWKPEDAREKPPHLIIGLRIKPNEKITILSCHLGPENTFPAFNYPIPAALLFFMRSAGDKFARPRIRCHKKKS